MIQKFFSLNLDFLGFSASLLCAIHCAAIPLLLAVGALSGLAWLEHHWVELVFIGLSFLFATASLIPSYRNQHGRQRPLQIVAVGFGLIVLAHLLPHEYEHWIMVVAGSSIAYAHWVNWRLLRKHAACECL